MTTTRKVITVSTRMERDLVLRLQRVAKADERSIGATIRRLISKALQTENVK